MVLPQLSSESSVQYQVRRMAMAYSSSNRLAGGSLIRGINIRRLKRVWEVSYRGLSDQEYAEVDEFRQALEAASGDFTFLDPFGNLLSHSEDLTSTWWQSDPLITVNQIGQPGAWGGQIHAVANGGNSVQSVWQELGVAGRGKLCASGRFRSNATDAGRLVVRSGAATYYVPVQTEGEWTQLYVAASIETDATPLTLSVEVAPGCTMDVKDLQLEQQPFPSRYKATRNIGGVYLEARIVHDSYEVVQQGPGWFDCSFRIEA